MNEHLMNINPLPLEMIREGKKTIELRLYDEKRRLIAIGDTIKFVNTEDKNDVLNVTVQNIYVFQSFEELYANLPLLKCGYTEKNVFNASPDDMDLYYSKDRQNQYGVIGIEVSLISLPNVKTV